EAIRACPDIRFEMTGDFAKAGIDPAGLPPNLSALGFVPYEQYLDHMERSLAVGTFSNRSHIMQMAVHEAISLGIPVVTNHSEALEEVLEDGGIYCSLDVASMASGFRKAVSERESLREQARALYDRRCKDVAAELVRLKQQVPALFEG